jgi:hypothetical protein
MSAGFIWLAGALPAFAAGDVPRFDVERHCKEVASFGGTYSAALDKSCFDMEQSAYDNLKARWSEVSSSMAAHCSEVAAFGGPGSYSLLESCIRMESEAAGSVGGREFKY